MRASRKPAWRNSWQKATLSVAPAIQSGSSPPVGLAAPVPPQTRNRPTSVSAGEHCIAEIDSNNAPMAPIRWAVMMSVSNPEPQPERTPGPGETGAARLYRLRSPCQAWAMLKPFSELLYGPDGLVADLQIFVLQDEPASRRPAPGFSAPPGTTKRSALPCNHVSMSLQRGSGYYRSRRRFVQQPDHALVEPVSQLKALRRPGNVANHNIKP